MKSLRVPTLILTSVVLATGLFAQTPPHVHDHSAPPPAPEGKPGQAKPGTMDDQMMAHCHAMMQMHSQMETDFKAQDAKLDALVTKMNTSIGADRAEAMGAVVTELVAQHKAQRDKMMSMHSEMMAHMMEHMQMGKQSMMMCPMMKTMQAPKSDANPSDDHSHHHPQ